MNEENKVEETTKPKNILDLIKDRPEAPSQEVIDGWKTKFGNVYISGFSDDEVYIWRALTRVEYRQVQITNHEISQIQKPDEAIAAQMRSEENMVSMCLLWPKCTGEELANSNTAGTVPTLLEQIMQNSHFVTPQQAGMLVMKL